ncbi:hypothetical protein KAU11_09545, partial [Candidatus Babeliales bacterium]|nr:hypothetical protein [Candidatus Babeliales bacterium]
VEQLWESDHSAIRQVGVFTDDTGIIKFVSWEKSNLPLMEEGVIYRIGKVPVTEFDERLQVALVGTTEITRVEQTETLAETPAVPTV